MTESYQRFFEFMEQEHNLILTLGQMDDIVHEAALLHQDLIADQARQLIAVSKICEAHELLASHGQSVPGIDIGLMEIDRMKDRADIRPAHIMGASNLLASMILSALRTRAEQKALVLVRRNRTS